MLTAQEKRLTNDLFITLIENTNSKIIKCDTFEITVYNLTWDMRDRISKYYKLLGYDTIDNICDNEYHLIIKW